MMNAREMWHHLLQECYTEGWPEKPYDMHVQFMGGGDVQIGEVGFSSLRWIRYCDFYLGGGPPFEAFLDAGKGTWLFENHAGHTKGSCLTELRIEADCIVARSRAVMLAPTGILDFKLLGMMSDRLGLPVRWHIGELNCSKAFLVSVAHLIPQGDSEWLKDFWAVYKRNKTSKFARHRAMYHNPAKKKTEHKIAQSFTFCILRDFTWAYAGGKDFWKEHDNLFMRALRQFKDDEGWFWNELPLGMWEAVKEHLPSLPSLNDLATSRSGRLSRLNGVSEQSKFKGYIKRKN